MMAQFMMDLKTEPRLSPSLYSPASPKMTDGNGRPQSTDSGVLDLSKRRDSLDARKTPSPSYHCYSDVGGTPPPSNHSSPQSEPVVAGVENTILLNYGELVRARRLSPSKSLLHFDEFPANHGHQTPAVQAFHRHGLALGPKPETDILHQHLLQHRSAAIPSYLLPAAAAAAAMHQQQHHHHHHHRGQQEEDHQQTSPAPFSPSPVRHRELDVVSESGSEGTSHVSSSQRKGKEEDGVPSGKDGQSSNQYPMVVGRDGKLSRPFKAYPRDPLSLAAGFVASDTILDTNSAEKYNLFRKRMLEQIHAANGGQPTVSNPKMRRLATSSKSATSSIALSDASSESCDEKPPSGQSENNMAKVSDETNPPDGGHRTKGDMMTQRSANQRLTVVTPSQDSCDSAHPTTVAPSSSTMAPNGNGVGPSVKDTAYYERRKKNNAAAKKSRDRRRIKEDEIAIRAAFLERENIELKFELAAARKQLALYGVTTSVAS